MSGGIVIAGMGPGDPAQVPPALMKILQEVDRIFLRTERHPAVSALKEGGFKWQTFDALYEHARNFDELYRQIASAVIQEASNLRVAYVVPGHPMVAEKSVTLILESARQAGIDTRVVPAMSCLDALYATLKLDPTLGLTVVDALTLNVDGLDPGLGLIITQVYSQQVASDTKLTLMELYPDEYPVTVVRGAGLPEGERVEIVPLYALDRLPWIDHLTSVYLPPFIKGRERTLAGLKEIMARLRGKEGCPWDREQDHHSLKRYLVEETYEVLEAIEAADMHKLCEELGDLLLQIVFHARLAEERGDFTLADCLETICTKMRRRHPHVFGTISVNTSGEVLARWDKIKMAEKQKDGLKTPSLLSVPRGLPALLKALKVQEQAARVGFDWEDAAGVWSKVEEELEELREAAKGAGTAERTAELGDVLFALVNLARWLGVEPEEALQASVARFMERFQYIEEKARQKGLELEKLSLAEMDILWEEAKKVKENKG